MLRAKSVLRIDMETEDERTRKDLVLKEEQLLENDTRNDADKIARMIDKDCLEFTASGKQYNYRPGELFGVRDGVSYIDSKTIRFIDLSGDCKLMLYTAVKVNKNIRNKSVCSSVWKKKENDWKILFHQETACAE